MAIGGVMRDKLIEFIEEANRQPVYFSLSGRPGHVDLVFGADKYASPGCVLVFSADNPTADSEMSPAAAVDLLLKE